MKFTKKQIERYSRQIGVVGQKKLLKSKILIIGAGGLGSPIAIYLAAAGVGNIGIVDKDNVEISNLGRQIIFPTEQELKDKYHVVDYDVAKFFYEVINYYPEFERAFNRDSANILFEMRGVEQR